MAVDRIASLLASATEIAYGLGLGDRVVAVSHECDFPEEVRGKPRVTFANVDAEQPSGAINGAVRAASAAGRPLYAIDTAKLAELRPNLIVTQSQCDVCAVSFEDVVCAVREIDGLNDARIVDLNPNSLEGIFRDIHRVAGAAEVEERGRAYVAELRSRIRAVTETTASLTARERPKVVCLEWADPVMVAANWTPELIEMAGGRCDLARAGEKTTYTEWSTVRDYDPEVIVVAPCGFGLGRAMGERARLCELPGWVDSAAVRTNRAYAADGNAYFNRSGPRVVDTVELLAGLIHPNLFPGHREAFAAVWRALDGGGR